MSLAISEPRTSNFVTRFDRVWASLRRYQVRQGLAWSLLAAALGLMALVAADYRLELPWRVRAAGLAALSIVVLAVLAARVVSPLRWWTRPRTAAEIESRFPQLGQRIRTVVQYAGLPTERIDSEGVTPSLVGALEEETEIQAQPLPLDRLVPWRRVWAVLASAAASLLVLLVAAAVNPEWRIALERALLSRRLYTTLAVAPGHLTIEQGASVPIKIELTGRLDRHVLLYTRHVAQPDSCWTITALGAPDGGLAPTRESKLEKVQDPMEYRVVAGPASSPTYRIDVRYPVAIKSFDVALKPPAYTGVAPTTVKGGDLRVIEGTHATLQIAFDSPPDEASLVLTDPAVRSKKDKSAPSRVIPLVSDGARFTADLDLTKALVYQIEARMSDGRSLPRNSYRIDVLEDHPPRVTFEQPDVALEVHPIAEVLNRIRVGDDFGLTKAGIVFQFNAGEEQTLVVRDFRSEPAKSSPTTAALEEMLLVEKLTASPTDSLTYYAFAEDNYPAGARRTETELRYIDIRPFKREYKLAESGDEMEGTGELTSLGELIARQRFNLNRATRLARHKPGDRVVAEDPLKIAGFEETLAGLTREFTEGVEGIVGQRVEPLHAAEEAMLGAIAALDHGQNARAPADMAVALRHLIEARDTLRIMIGEDSAAARKMRAFDRTQTQKIRKPKKDEAEAEEIAEQLEALANDEDFVYATLAGLKMEQPNAQPNEAKGAAPGESDAEEPKEPAKKNDEDQKSDETSKGAKGQKGTGTGQGKGRTGEKGEPKNAEREGEPTKDGREEARERQEKIADRARELEEKLKKLEVASDLAKARMAKAAEAAEKASGALARGRTKEATETAKAGAAMLHELARQVKGEIARDVAQELAMARDLADSLAEKEASLSQTPGSEPGSGTGQGEEPGQDGKNAKGQKGSPTQDGAEADQPGEDGKSENAQEGSPTQGGTGGRGVSGRGGGDNLTDAERLERLEEAAKTLEQWLKDASLRAEGKSAEQIRELLEKGDVTRIVERAERIGALYMGGQKPAAQRDAQELSRILEVLARQLDVLHRGIVAPELAALVEFDTRIKELTAKLHDLRTDADIGEWHRLAATLIRDLQKAGVTDGAAALAVALEAEVRHHDRDGWHWPIGPHDFRLAPGIYASALTSLTTYLHAKMQDLILKDMASARDESTPPQFKELVERYYEVLSKSSGSKD
jgi:hypothetical protein